MDKKKRTPRRSAHNELYTPAEGGGYNYIGSYWRYELAPAALRRMKLAYAGFTLVLALLFITGGVCDFASSRVAYVVLPFVGNFLPLAFMVGDVVRIAAAPEKMTVRQYERGVLQLRRCTVAVAVLSVISAVGDIVFILASAGEDGGSAVREIGFFAVCAALASLSIIFWKFQKKIKCLEIAEKNAQ